MKNKQDSYRYGLFAETLASWGLQLRGYRILARRYKTRGGEIDLIACRGRVLAFVEVKARGNLPAALEAVSPRAQQRIAQAARYFIAQNAALADYEMRFDLIALAPPFYWKHLDNAFRPSA